MFHKSFHLSLIKNYKIITFILLLKINDFIGNIIYFCNKRQKDAAKFRNNVIIYICLFIKYFKKELMVVNCPYCKKELISGFIYGDRYALKWLPEEKKLTGGIFAFGGERIGTKGHLKRPRVKGYKCTSCNKIVIDLNE